MTCRIQGWCLLACAAAAAGLVPNPAWAQETVARSPYEPGTLGMGGVGLGAGFAIGDGPLGFGAAVTVGLGRVDVAAGISDMPCFSCEPDENGPFWVHGAVQGVIHDWADGLSRFAARATFDLAVGGGLRGWNLGTGALRFSHAPAGYPNLRVHAAVAVLVEKYPDDGLAVGSFLLGGKVGLEYVGSVFGVHASIGPTTALSAATEDDFLLISLGLTVNVDALWK